MEFNQKTFKYKDCSKPIKGWPFWGQEICLIFFADDITAADELFKQHHPEHSKNKAVTVSILD